MLAGRLDSWESSIRHVSVGARLGYQGRNDGITVGLLQPPGPGPWEDFTCLMSLRDVEPTVNLILEKDVSPPKESRDWLFPQKPKPGAQAEAKPEQVKTDDNP